MSDDRLRKEGRPEVEGDAGVPPIEEEIAEGLLDGTIVAGDVAAPYARVAEVLAAAAGPARPDELVGEEAVLAAFRAVYAGAAPAGPVVAAGTLEPRPISDRAATAATYAPEAGAEVPAWAARRPLRTRSTSPGPARRRRGRAAYGASGRRPSRRLARPAALLVVLAVLGGLGASATAAILTLDYPRTPRQSVATTTVDVHPPVTAAAPTTTIPADPTDSRGSGRSLGGGPGGGTPAERSKQGLCRAWQAGELDPATDKHKAGLFEALAKAAGGADRIDAYCGADPQQAPPGKGSQPHPEPGQLDGVAPGPKQQGADQQGAGEESTDQQATGQESADQNAATNRGVGQRGT